MNKIRNAQARIHAAVIARGHRGVSTEYALLAVLAIIMISVLFTPLRGVFNDLKDKLTSFSSDAQTK
jgi:hypothetical protein